MFRRKQKETLTTIISTEDSSYLPKVLCYTLVIFLKEEEKENRKELFPTIFTMSFDNLPPEIILMILQPHHYITPPPLFDAGRESAKQYSKLRLVSRTFSLHITPHIFRNITIKSAECSLKRLETIAKSECIRGWVKQYTYRIIPNSRIPRPARGIHDEYLRLTADPSGLEELEGVQSSKDPTMASISSWLDQREFELSNDLDEIHVKSLSQLPVLRSIHLMSPTWCGLSEVSSNTHLAMSVGGRSWGPVVFRAILLAMYNRTQTKNKTPIEDFVVEGITEECMLLPPSFIKKAISAFQTIKSLRIHIQASRTTQECSTPGWIVLVGRLIQSIDSLETLDIGVLESHTNIHFRTLVSPYKSKLINKPATAPVAPRWPKLKELILRDVIFVESHILEFLSSHRSLRLIEFSNCDLKPNSEPTFPDDSDAISNSDAPIPNPWLAVLHQIYKLFGPKSSSPLELFEIDRLYYDPIRQKHMHSCEIKSWKEYISGITTTEPAPCGRELCKECKEEGYLTDEISITDDGFFFGIHPFFETDVDDDLEEDTEEDIDADGDDDDDLLTVFPPMHMYGWPDEF